MSTTPPSDANRRPPVTTPLDHRREAMPWGELIWAVSQERGNSDDLTVGWCVIDPGEANPRHHHPNCQEVLVVLEGAIAHSMGESEFEMQTGDTIVIPQNVVHNARNIGEVPARLLICFSSADRKTVGE